MGVRHKVAKKHQLLALQVVVRLFHQPNEPYRLLRF